MLENHGMLEKHGKQAGGSTYCQEFGQFLHMKIENCPKTSPSSKVYRSEILKTSHFLLVFSIFKHKSGGLQIRLIIKL